MALSSGHLVSSIISPRAGKGGLDCSKTKLNVRQHSREYIPAFYSFRCACVIGSWGRMDSRGCKGISFPDDQKVKISQFADNTTITTENVESLKPHLQILDRFGNVSGLKLNKKKQKLCGWVR